MENMNWERIITSEKYFKFEENTNYSIVFANWKIEEKNFGKNGTKWVLTLDVLQCDDDKETILGEQDAPKEFSTGSQSFILQIRPMIEKAMEKREKTIWVQIKKISNNKYELFDLNSVLKKVRK